MLRELLGMLRRNGHSDDRQARYDVTLAKADAAIAEAGSVERHARRVLATLEQRARAVGDAYQDPVER